MIGWGAAIARRLAFLATTTLLVVALLVCAEIFARSVLRVSLVGVSDISGLLIAAAIAGAFPIATMQRGHLLIELLDRKMGARAALVFGCLGVWVMTVALALLTWRIGLTALDFTRRGSTTHVIEMPIAPFLWGVTGCLAVAGLFQLLLAVKDTGGFLARWRREAAPSLRTISFIVVGLVPIVIVAAGLIDGGARTSWLIPGAPVWIALLFFGVLWVASLAMLPLGAVMLLVGLSGAAVMLGDAPALNLVATRTIDLLASDILLILPLFLLMGSFAQIAGLSTDMYRLAHALMGHLRGGLALATVGACAGFGAITGSSLATSLTVGQAAYPEMRRFGYSEELATGAIAAGGTLGQIVPPSAVIVLYAILTETSVGALFIAAAVPAVLVILFFSLAVIVQVRLSPEAAPQAMPREPGVLLAALRGIWPSLGLIVVVLGGIYGGVFTVTEAASVGALGAFVLAWWRGNLDRAALARVMVETAERTAMIYMLIIGGSIFAFFIGVTQLPVQATTMLTQFDLPGLAVVALALLIYILLGMVMEAYAIMIITVPVIAPILLGLDFDLIWWGIVMVMVVEIGLLTPPFGMNCFILKAVAADVALAKVFKGVTPFVIADLMVLALLVLIPSLVLWLPGVLL